MNSKVIRLNSYLSIEDLKVLILRKLNSGDGSKKSLMEFDKRVAMFFTSNPNQEVILQLDRSKIEEDLAFKLSLANRVAQPFPENFEMGNPLNRWIFDSFTGKTPDEIKKERADYESAFQAKRDELTNFITKLEQLSQSRIVIKYN